jgi:hypothetical protein
MLHLIFSNDLHPGPPSSPWELSIKETNIFKEEPRYKIVFRRKEHEKNNNRLDYPVVSLFKYSRFCESPIFFLQDDTTTFYSSR